MISLNEELFFEKIFNMIEYKFKNRDLIKEALTRQSAIIEDHPFCASRNFQRLEILGDSVLSLIITDFLFELYPDKSEKDISQIKQDLTSNKKLGEFAMLNNLGQFLLMGKGEEKHKVRNNPKVLADNIESIIGAVYLDNEKNLPVTQRLIINWMKNFLFENTNYFNKFEFQNLLDKYTTILEEDDKIDYFPDLNEYLATLDKPEKASPSIRSDEIDIELIKDYKVKSVNYEENFIVTHLIKEIDKAHQELNLARYSYLSRLLFKFKIEKEVDEDLFINTLYNNGKVFCYLGNFFEGYQILINLVKYIDNHSLIDKYLEKYMISLFYITDFYVRMGDKSLLCITLEKYLQIIQTKSQNYEEDDLIYFLMHVLDFYHSKYIKKTDLYPCKELIQKFKVKAKSFDYVLNLINVIISSADAGIINSIDPQISYIETHIKQSPDVNIRVFLIYLYDYYEKNEFCEELKKVQIKYLLDRQKLIRKYMQVTSNYNLKNTERINQVFQEVLNLNR